MSANADYDVKIVESFAPPKNWLPGQEVEKDVYAVNTGSIGAFVEEDVTSKITITQEKEVGEWTNACVKLTPAERYSVEAGSYLALAPATSTKVLGTKVVNFNENDNPTTLEDYTPNTVLTDFVPDVAGLYVFRRILKVNNDRTEEFEYQAYYFDGTDYYKAKLTSVTQDTVPDLADDNKDTDGILTAATAKYYTETQQILTPTLEYLEDNTGKWLIATVPGTDATGVDLSTLGDNYDKALHNYELALAELDRAVDEDDTATAEEKSTLNAYNAAQLAKQAAEKAYNEALANLNATRSQLAAAIADRDTADTGVKAKRDAAFNTVYGEGATLLTTGYTDNDGKPTGTPVVNTNYKTGSKYAIFKDKYDAVSAFTPNTKEDFFNELMAYAPSASGEAVDTSSITGGYSEANLAALIDLFTYDQLTHYAATESHTHFKALGEYYAAKKDYETELAKFEALDAALTELNTRIGDSNSGLIKQFNTQYTDVYGAIALTEYGTADAAATPASMYTTAVSKLSTDPADPSTVAEGVTTYNSRTDKYGKLLAAVADEKAKQTAYNTAHTTASDASTGTSAHRTAAEQAAQAAKYALDAAKQAYEDGLEAVQGAGPLKINIKLSDKVTTQGGTKDEWQILPSTVQGNVAKFYYTGILLGGETSAQLIDSVTLDSSVTEDMYKSFDFDLDVALKSAQITYAADNETIMTDAVATNLSATPTLSNPTDIETALNWT